MSAGRPTDYNPEIARVICERIALGDNLDKLSRDADMPSKQCIYNWFGKHPEFVDDYARARTVRADSRSDRIDEYKDRCLAGEIAPDVARVVIDVEKWQAGKENAKKYGDKMQTEHSGNMTVNWPLPRTKLDD